VRRCLRCGRLARGACPSCAKATKAARNRDAARCAATVAEHRRVHGDWCPGWGVPPHAATDLTADHLVAVSRGGVNGALRVLCRSCNARRGRAQA